MQGVHRLLARPHRWRVLDCSFALGAALGTVDGYPEMRGGGFFLALLPVASLE